MGLCLIDLETVKSKNQIFFFVVLVKKRRHNPVSSAGLCCLSVCLCPFFLKEHSVEEGMCWLFQCCVYRRSVWDYSAGKSE